jgi:hypothetical protein
VIVDIDGLRGLDAFRQAETRLSERLTELDREAQGMPFNDDQRAEFEEIAGDDGVLARVRNTIEELELRSAMIKTAVEADGRAAES